MSTKFIEDIRRIAKTYEILKKIPNNGLDKDKSSILGNRGVGQGTAPFNPCQYLYSTEDGQYTAAQIIDGRGPKVTDDTSNQCDVLNTIRGMKEVGSDPTLVMILKPDGVFLPPSSAAEFYYTSDAIMQDYLDNPGDYDPSNKWAFSTEEEAANKTQLLFYDEYSSFFYNDTATIGSPTTPTNITLTEGDIGDANYSINYPVWLTLVSASGNILDDVWKNTCGSDTYDNLADLPDPGITGGGSPTYNSEMTANTILVDNPVGDIPVDMIPGNEWLYYRLPGPDGGCTFPLYFRPANPEGTLSSYYYIFSIPTNYDATLDPEEYEETPLVYGPLCYTDTGDFQNIQPYFPGEMPDFNASQFQLAIDVGNTWLWKPNPEESTAPTKYSQGVSIVDFEFGVDYARTGRIIPSKDGGFIIYETVASVPSGSAYVFRHNRTLEAVIGAGQLSAYAA